MRKQGFLMSSTQLPTVLECSSIRINDEDLENMNVREHPRNINFKQFEENSLNGLEGSLSMAGSKDNILELMRSKSAQQIHRGIEKHILHNQSKHISHNQSQTGYAASLYNTSSFDDMTMKMTINRTQLGSPTQFNDNWDFKLKKPEEMKTFKTSYADSEMKIVLNKQIKVQEKNSSPIKEELVETKEEREARERRVAEFQKRQSLLDNLKCSNADSEPSRNFDDTSSFQEPYFKTPAEEASFQEAAQEAPFTKLENRKQSLQSENHVPAFNKSKDKTISQTSASSKGTKKLTLRDYLHLNELSGKIKQSETSSPVSLRANNSAFSTSSPRSPVQNSRKRKTISSNGEVVSRIRKEITSDIRLLKNNLDLLLNYFSEDREVGEPEHDEIMRIYGVGRMIKERMLAGNDQIIKIMRGDEEESTKNEGRKLS